MKQSRKIRIIIIVLSVLLGASLFALAETLSKAKTSENLNDTAVAQDNFITDEKTDEKTSGEGETGFAKTAGKPEALGAKFDAAINTFTRPLRSYMASCYAYAGSNEITLSGDSSENIPFELKNMFPGDSSTQVFRVKVKHSGTVKVHCEAVVDSAYETAAKAMKVRVKIGKNEEQIYDGDMLEMPDSAVYTLTGSETTELQYTITAYMDTSAGNEFQNKKIKADFKWWLEEVSDGHGGRGGSTVKPTDSDKDDDGKIDEDKDGDKDDGKDDGDKDKPSKDEKDSKDSDSTKGDKTGKETGKKGGAPKTGDSSELFLWIGLAALTGGGAIFLVAKKRQKDGEEHD